MRGGGIIAMEVLIFLVIQVLLLVISFSLGGGRTTHILILLLLFEVEYLVFVGGDFGERSTINKDTFFSVKL